MKLEAPPVLWLNFQIFYITKCLKFCINRWSCFSQFRLLNTFRSMQKFWQRESNSNGVTKESSFKRTHDKVWHFVTSLMNDYYLSFQTRKKISRIREWREVRYVVVRKKVEIDKWLLHRLEARTKWLKRYGKKFWQKRIEAFRGVWDSEVNFANVLRSAFTIEDPEGIQRQSSHQCLFALLESVCVKAARKTLVELIYPRYQCVCVCARVCEREREM